MAGSNTEARRDNVLLGRLATLSTRAWRRNRARSRRRSAPSDCCTLQSVKNRGSSTKMDVELLGYVNWDFVSVRSIVAVLLFSLVSSGGLWWCCCRWFLWKCRWSILIGSTVRTRHFRGSWTIRIRSAVPWRSRSLPLSNPPVETCSEFLAWWDVFLFR